MRAHTHTHAHTYACEHTHTHVYTYYLTYIQGNPVKTVVKRGSGVRQRGGGGVEMGMETWEMACNLKECGVIKIKMGGGTLVAGGGGVAGMGVGWREGAGSEKEDDQKKGWWGWWEERVLL